MDSLIIISRKPSDYVSPFYKHVSQVALTLTNAGVERFYTLIEKNNLETFLSEEKRAPLKLINDSSGITTPVDYIYKKQPQ